MAIGRASGHLIQLDKNTCSDGIISALSIISIAYKEDQDIDSLLDGFHKLPSILKIFQLVILTWMIIKNLLPHLEKRLVRMGNY